MNIPKCILKESYLKRAEMKISHQHARKIKPGDSIRVNLNISKGFNRTIDSLQEVELTFDMHAIERERQFFEVTLVQAGMFDIQADAKAQKSAALAEMIEVECSRILFPLVKETVVMLSKKSGFNHHFFDHIEFEQLVNTPEASATHTKH